MLLQISTILPLVLFFSLVATTLAKNDQSFECVDIYKQPSLQHPLLKDHKLQITLLNQTGSSSICPKGMVPIYKSLHKNVNNSLIAQDAVNWATLDTQMGSNRYYGASAVLSVNNPSFSGKASRALVIIGSPLEFNCIQFGWAINPELYGDQLTHFTTYWTSDGTEKTGCYDTKCQGFVQGFSDLHPGMPFDKVSTYGGEQVELSLSIIRDADTGNWMLMKFGAVVGYWPKELFPNLESGATIIRYGGITVGGAPMGNGRFPDGGNDLSKSSYIKGLAFVDATLQSKPINQLETNVNTPKSNCYKLNYLKDGQTITYGGGSCSN